VLVQLLRPGHVGAARRDLRGNDPAVMEASGQTWWVPACRRVVFVTATGPFS